MFEMYKGIFSGRNAAEHFDCKPWDVRDRLTSAARSSRKYRYKLAEGQIILTRPSWTNWAKAVLTVRIDESGEGVTVHFDTRTTRTFRFFTGYYMIVGLAILIGLSLYAILTRTNWYDFFFPLITIAFLLIGYRFFTWAHRQHQRFADEITSFARNAMRR